MLELHFQDDQNEIRHPTKILFWDTTNILFVETPGVERAAEEREEDWIKAKAISRQLVKSGKNNQDVKLIEVVQCSVRDCSSPCPGDLVVVYIPKNVHLKKRLYRPGRPGDLVVAYFVTHAAGKLSRLIDYQEEE